jgi:hypothetical protein
LPLNLIANHSFLNLKDRSHEQQNFEAWMVQVAKGKNNSIVLSIKTIRPINDEIVKNLFEIDLIHHLIVPPEGK